MRARVHEIENHIYSQERAGKVKSLSFSLVLPLGRSGACSFLGGVWVGGFALLCVIISAKTKWR